jgi:hypothetical protein
MAKVNTQNSPLFQSGYTYLDAAGSSGADKTIPGCHLRWDLLGTLGNNHLPKGSYAQHTPYQTSSGFNKADDVVNIYKMPFFGRHYIEWNTSVKPDGQKTSPTGVPFWGMLLPVESSNSNRETEMRIYFTDVAQYNALATTYSFATQWGKILDAYTGIIEVSCTDKLSFYWQIVSSVADPDVDSGNYSMRIEAVSLPNSLEPNEKQLNYRDTHNNYTSFDFFSENTERIRFDKTNNKIERIRVITYEDFIEESNEGTGAWQQVGSFALSLDDSDMHARLRTTEIDGTWPKFSITSTSGEFAVNAENYVDRWQGPGYNFDSLDESDNDPRGLQTFIHTYLKASTTDPKATVSFPSDDPNDDTVQTVSCLDMIRLMSLDFHVARTLGLGHIDTTFDQGYYQSYYVYCLQYLTKKGLDAPFNGTVDHSHVYMTLPVISRNDSRLPVAPKLEDVTFGANIDNATNEPAVLTDANGYTPQENLRFINLNRAPHAYEKPFGTFFHESTPIDLSRQTQAIGYGLKYMEVNESDYRKPDLNHDADFLDLRDIAETTIILENGGPRLYTHMEEEEGSHAYSAYAINWFSRVSHLSNEKIVTTLFPKITRLLPPFNYAVQLIQDEDPAESAIAEKALVFTTIQEQQQLAALPVNTDHTLVRTTFDWNHIQNNAHPTVNYAEFFFREKDPLVVKGKITDVIQLDTETVLVKTGSYAMTSVFPAQTVVPTILSGNASRFVGSLFSSGQQGYFVEQVQNAGNAPWFKVKALKQNQAVAPDPSNQNQFLSQESYSVPQVGDLFFVVENTTEAANWDLKHTQRTYIEKYYTNANIGLRTSVSNVVNYGIKSVSTSGFNTIIELHEKLKISDYAGINAEYMIRTPLVSLTSNQVKMSGNRTSQLTNGSTFYLFGNAANDNVYTVSGSGTYNLTQNATTFNVVQTVPSPATTGGFVSFKIQRPLNGLNETNNTISISGNLLPAEIDAAHVEYRTESDGTQTRFVVGGITAPVTFEPLLNENGTGSGYIQVFMDYTLAPHPDPRVSWSKGTIRLKTLSGDMQSYPVSYIGNLTSTTTSDLALVIQDPGFIPEDPASPGSGDLYTLDLDATTEKGNYHPSYRLYLPYSNGVHPVTGAPVAIGDVHFNELSTLPLPNDPAVSNKKTFMSARSVDVIENAASFLSAPSTLLAQKITIPVAPGLPQGPLYATRPDFYGKSTYTFDTSVDTTGGRSPYALVFMKSTNDKLLDVLYKKETQAIIEGQWNNLSPDVKLDLQLWQILINGISEPGSPAEFAIYETTAGTFQWPMPDNASFYIPFETRVPIMSLVNPQLFCPFKVSQEFSLTKTYDVYGRNTTALELLKRAVNDCFIPLNEQPPLFMHLKSGRQTSSAPSVIRDTNGILLNPQTNDIYPMIRTFTEEGVTYVRFTDYTLDGASNCLYFYRAMEMDEKFKFSDAGDALGPVVMVNSYYPERPQIRKVLTRMENPSEEISAGIVFELNPYAESEIISKLDIYRAIGETDALSTRTMTKVKTIAWGQPLVDDFANDPFPLFGEDLTYRLVAVREVKDVRDVLGAAEAEIVEIPSHPSDMVKAKLIDVINPPAPDLEFMIGGVTDDEFTDVLIGWPTTCYNGSYSLQKMNDSGNWVEIYHTSQKTGNVSYPPLVNGVPDFVTHTATALFPRKDEDGQLIYHRFRVQVENSSGLFNLQEKVFILQQLDLVQEDGGNINLEDNSGSLLV